MATRSESHGVAGPVRPADGLSGTSVYQFVGVLTGGNQILSLPPFLRDTYIVGLTAIPLVTSADTTSVIRFNSNAQLTAQVRGPFVQNQPISTGIGGVDGFIDPTAFLVPAGSSIEIQSIEVALGFLPPCSVWLTLAGT